MRADLYLRGRLHQTYTLSPDKDRPCLIAKVMWDTATRATVIVR